MTWRSYWIANWNQEEDNQNQWTVGKNLETMSMFYSFDLKKFNQQSHNIVIINLDIDK